MLPRMLVLLPVLAVVLFLPGAGAPRATPIEEPLPRSSVATAEGEAPLPRPKISVAIDKPDVARTTNEVPGTGPARQIDSWYETWNGRVRRLTLLVPRTTDTRPIPLLVSLHGSGLTNACRKEFSVHANRHRFIVACPDGQGARTRLFSYGAPGHIADLAAMPGIVATRLPDVAFDPKRTYVAGSSMGGMEALLVGLRHPRAYAAAVPLNGVSNLPHRYDTLPRVRKQAIAYECGGTLLQKPACYNQRSPHTHVRKRPADAGRLIIWYSTKDPVSGHPRQIPDLLRRAQKSIGANRSIEVRRGTWGHGMLWNRDAHRNTWLADLGLIPDDGVRVPVVRSRIVGS